MDSSIFARWILSIYPPKLMTTMARNIPTATTTARMAAFKLMYFTTLPNVLGYELLPDGSIIDLLHRVCTQTRNPLSIIEVMKTGSQTIYYILIRTFKVRS